MCVASFRQLIKGTNCTSPRTHPRCVSAGVSENKSLPDPIAYPCFQKQLMGQGVIVHSQAVSPPVFDCLIYCKWSKNWKQEWPGNKAILYIPRLFRLQFLIAWYIASGQKTGSRNGLGTRLSCAKRPYHQNSYPISRCCYTTYSLVPWGGAASVQHGFPERSC